MLVRKKLLPGTYKYFYGLLLTGFIAIVCVAFKMADSNDFDITRREILLRQIGHEVLLQSGDSTSRVLPVKKTAENEYQLSFENAFSFKPELLVNTTKLLLATDPLTNNYVVNVLNCGNSSVVYGYAISNNKKDDIISCIGRAQPKACYIVNIKFEPTGISTAKSGYLLGSFSLLGFAGLIFYRSARRKKALPETPDTGMFTLGSMLFNTDARKLMINGETIELTRTETRVLCIFALSPNEVIARSRLQKEIWEDEGVIVGRSLDMFISKLRKKLEPDASIKIAVVRGKGYKLEVGG